MTVPLTFSIVVPTYRRPDRLAACVESLAALDYPRERFQIIVVDDGSGNPPESELARVRGHVGVTLVVRPHGGPAAARNTGAAHAQGHYLAFTDDDCMPDRGWLGALEARFAVVPDHAVGGRTVNALPDNPYSTASQLLVDYFSAWHLERGDGPFFPSSNLAVPADRFRKLDGFHQGFALAAGEDREFCHRWARAGGRMSYAPEAVVRHAHPLTLRSFWRQHFIYGCGAFQFHRLLRSEGRPRANPLSFYLGLIGCPLHRTQDRRRRLLVGLLALAQAATAAGYSREWLRQAPREPSRRGAGEGPAGSTPQPGCSGRKALFRSAKQTAKTGEGFR